jgi:hypothetical protein
MVPLAFLTQTVMGLVQGHLNKVLDAYITDVELRRKLAAELQTQFMGELAKVTDRGADVVMAEVKSDYWLSRSWRPALMLVLMGFLVLAGLLLPLLDVVAGKTVVFTPPLEHLAARILGFFVGGHGRLYRRPVP